MKLRISISLFICSLIFGWTSNVYSSDSISNPEKKFYSIKQARLALEQLKSDEQNIILREKNLYDQTVRLRQQYQSKYDFSSEQDYREQKEQLYALLNYQSIAYIPIVDAGREQYIPAFQISASARTTLDRWEVGNYAEEFDRELEQSSNKYIEYFSNVMGDENNEDSASDYLQSQRYKKILAANLIIEKNQKYLNNEIEQSILTSFNEKTTAKNLDQTQYAIPTLFILQLAKAQKSVSLYKIAFRSLETDQSYEKKITQLKLKQVLQEISHKDSHALSSNDKFELLNYVLEYSKEHPQYIEMALLGLVQYIDTDQDILLMLNSQLKDLKYGASAAKAMSQSNNLRTLKLLEDNLNTIDKSHKDFSILLKRSLLAIYLIKNNKQSLMSDAATEVLEKFYRTTDDLQLKKVLDQWLK